MDAKIRDSIEQGKKELSKGTTANDSNVRAIITAIAGYLSNSSLSQSERSEIQRLKQQLEQLKK